jgi:hypothetical protein
MPDCRRCKAEAGNEHQQQGNGKPPYSKPFTEFRAAISAGGDACAGSNGGQGGDFGMTPGGFRKKSLLLHLCLQQKYVR